MILLRVPVMQVSTAVVTAGTGSIPKLVKMFSLMVSEQEGSEIKVTAVVRTAEATPAQAEARRYLSTERLP